MALLFPREEDKDFAATTDAATRSLSAISLETSFVEGVYEKMASVYDLFFGLPLHHGRATAIRRMAIKPNDQILEVGVGTGISLPLYPRKCSVTAIDLSDGMLERARTRVEQYSLRNVHLIQMDATKLKFPDNSFDIVYAPYFISCVPDPLAVTREMRRVCRPGGSLVFLNHFLSDGSDRVEARARDCAADGAPRLQVRFRSAGVSRADRAAGGVDRKGERAAHLVAGDLRQR